MYIYESLVVVGFLLIAFLGVTVSISVIKLYNYRSSVIGFRQPWITTDLGCLCLGR